MKKILFIISGLSIFIISGVGLWKLNKNSFLLWNSNSIKVTTENPLVPNSVKIELGMSVSTIGCSDSTDFFLKQEQYTVLYDGEEKEAILNEYGEHDFCITYGSRYYFFFRHFKFNRRHQHDYNFHFFKKDRTMFVRASIHGADAMAFEKPMLEIPTAVQLILLSNRLRG